MKKQFLSILFLALCMCLFGANTITYIDPTFTGTSTGSITQPLKSVPTILSNTTYLFKGGTTFHSNNNIGGTVDNCKISTYGSGKATIFFNTSVSGRLVNLRGSNNTIENLNVVTNNHFGSVKGVDDPNECTPVELYITGGRGTLKNIAVKGGWRGIVGSHYGYYTGTMVIDSCSIDSVQSDGFYVTYLDSLIVHKAKSTNCNINWAKDYGGDSFQEGNTLHIIFDSCYFDHSSYPGKYSLIANDYYEAQITNCYFKSYNGEGCLYPSSSDSFFTATNISNCIFDGGMRGIQNRSDNTIITNCLFKGNSQTHFAIDGAVKLQVTNCTFVNYKDTVIGSFGTNNVLVSTLNNNIFYNNKGGIVVNTGNSVGSNNDFYNTPINPKLVLTGTIATKPIFKDTINYVATNLSGIGYNISIPVVVTPIPAPIITPTPVVPTVDSLSIYRKLTKTVIIPGLQNKTTTKANILIQVQKIVK